MLHSHSVQRAQYFSYLLVIFFVSGVIHGKPGCPRDELSARKNESPLSDMYFGQDVEGQTKTQTASGSRVVNMAATPFACVLLCSALLTGWFGQLSYLYRMT